MSRPKRDLNGFDYKAGLEICLPYSEWFVLINQAHSTKRLKGGDHVLLDAKGHIIYEVYDYKE